MNSVTTSLATDGGRSEGMGALNDYRCPAFRRLSDFLPPLILESEGHKVLRVFVSTCAAGIRLDYKV